MKQVVQGKKGVALVEVPPPILEPGTILVANSYSLISTGTEMSSISGARTGPIAKALKQPEKLLKLIDSFQKQGITRTINVVQGKLSALNPLGYSCAGVVVRTAEDVRDVKPGDRVACAGAGIANHAEYVVVPRNLTVKVPDHVSLRDASSTTLGAIAMQGTRRADLRLGEWAAVMGLGLLGQMTVQILLAAGIRVIGFDIDPRRVEKARSLGMSHGFTVSHSNGTNEVFQLTQGHGVDATIITAASKSDLLVQQAMEWTRKKGRVIVVGAVGLGLKRSPFYEKEIDFLISCSYGPGRYDPGYEERGVDYPFAYVRWTENRNMQEYLRLLADKKIDFSSLIEAEVRLEQVEQAYADLSGGQPPLAVVLRYPEAILDVQPAARIELKQTRKKVDGKIRVALVGAGSFAQAMHLPNLMKCADQYHLRAVVTRTGLTGRNLGLQFGSDYVTSDYEDVLNDADVDMVMICTRHNLHAEQSIRAMRAGKAVFVEKPAALTLQELDSVRTALQETQVPFMVGFNRRFSPAIRKAKEILAQNDNPIQMLYRVNAGYLPSTHWTMGPEGGGRIIGEACHMLDVFQFLVGSARFTNYQIAAVQPLADHLTAADNLCATIQYSNGSLATLIYTALGSSDLPKEHLEIFAGGKALILDDFKTLQVYGDPQIGWKSRIQDKGHLEEIKQLAKNIRGEKPAPIALDDIWDTTRLSVLLAQMNI